MEVDKDDILGEKPGVGSEEPEEAIGDDVQMNSDSSEEEAEDEAEAERVRQGFIVDEGDEEEDGDGEAGDEDDTESERRRRRRKRRKRHHRKHNAEEDDADDNMQLDDDDLELLAEQGASLDINRRLYKRKDASPRPSTSKRPVIASSDEELDGENPPRVEDLHRIWDDAREDEDDYMDDFIEDDEDEDTPMDQETREALRRQKRLEKLQARKAAQSAPPALEGLDASAWVEIHDVFGDGHEYDWALGEDEETHHPKKSFLTETRFQDVFEPSEIASRYLTEDDDLIRARDIPERLQLATSTLSKNATLSDLTDFQLSGAALWIIPRLPHAKQEKFFSRDAELQHLSSSLVSAVTSTLEYMFVEHYEVPYIWTHKRDHLAHFEVEDIRNRTELLDRNDLWRIHGLGQKYKSLLDRRRALDQLFERLNVTDEYYSDEIRRQLENVEMVADTTEWLMMKYKAKRKQNAEFTFHDDEEEDSSLRRQKMPSRISAYEVAKSSIISRLAEGFGIQPHQVVLNMLANQRLHFVDDQDLNPLLYAERFCDTDQANVQGPEEVLRRARLIIATELGKDPLLRNEIRALFKEDSVVSVEPTERGINKISDTHPYFNFKYLSRKPISQMLQSAQFLQILAAEDEHLVTLSISLPPQSKDHFENKLSEAFTSDNFSESARAWNEERAKVVREVLEQFLIPLGTKWTREYIREEVEDMLALQAGNLLSERLNVAPFQTENMAFGETPSVLAISWGKGDPLKDAIMLVYLDKDGYMREQSKIDNLVDDVMRDEFIDLVTRKCPDVIVLGGFTLATTKLSQRVRECLASIKDDNQWGGNAVKIKGTPVIYTHDDVARLYQHSPRATEEFATLPTTAKYCVGLARYVQNPLNEFAALGPDIIAITLDKKDQNLIPKEKLLSAFEHALVDITNEVGLEINRAVSNKYYQSLLPFIGGLGPRKARALIKKIVSLGGNVVNREQFVKAGLFTSNIFLNAVAFLRIVPNQDISSVKKNADAQLSPDPLDCSRIHPQDYEFAQKMASDALELDEEDFHDEHPSHVVTLIMDDPDNKRKLNELNLDEFAVSLHETNQQQKRHTLNLIRDELLRPFADHRMPHAPLQQWDVLTMLSGETSDTLQVGVIVPALVVRVSASGAAVRLDSGVEGSINRDYLANIVPNRCEDVVNKNQTVQGVVVAVNLDPATESILVELSIRPKELDGGDASFRQVKKDPRWDGAHYQKDLELLQRKKRADTDRSRRVIKHPNFHNFNASQAETYLEKHQRGDLVVRPSSKGMNHLAVTWKVDDMLYQHIDVTEPNPDPTGQKVTSQLVVDARHTYSDLDELIVNHVQAMARRVEELMAHERYKPGAEDELHVFLKNVLAANPAKSMYGFTLNRKKPGHFNLCFLASKQSSVQTWPVRVTPEAYYLFDTAAPGVPELCDAFKVRHLHESQNPSNSAVGRTPFGAGGRTPARPGYATTPGRMSTRQPTRTPNPYGGSTPRPAFGGGATPAQYGNVPTPGYAEPPTNNPGFQTPGAAGLPAGMNPQRAAMIQNQGGWGSGQGW